MSSSIEKLKPSFSGDIVSGYVIHGVFYEDELLEELAERIVSDYIGRDTETIKGIHMEIVGSLKMGHPLRVIHRYLDKLLDGRDIKHHHCKTCGKWHLEKPK